MSKIKVNEIEKASGSGITVPTGTSFTVTDGIAASSLTGTVAQANIADQAINEAKMQISNAPTNGHFLSAQSGNTGGLTWAEAGGGKVGQVLQGYKTTSETFSSSGTDYDIAGLTVTLTPASSSSKFLIISNIGGYSQNGSPQIFIKCNSSGSFSTVGVNTISSRRNTSFAGNLYTGDAAGTGEMMFSSNTCFLHSPNVSSAVTYKISGNANGETRINIKESDASSQDAGTSNITVMEILA